MRAGPRSRKKWTSRSSRKRPLFLITQPAVRDTQVFSAMPERFRKTGMRSVWADSNRGGHPVDSFLEGPVVDDLGNLYVTDIPFGRVFRISVTVIGTSSPSTTANPMVP